MGGNAQGRHSLSAVAPHSPSINVRISPPRTPRTVTTLNLAPSSVFSQLLAWPDRLSYLVLHIIGKTALIVSAFAPVLRVVNKGRPHKVPLKRLPHVARTLPPRLHPFAHNQTDQYPT